MISIDYEVNSHEITTAGSVYVQNRKIHHSQIISDRKREGILYL